MAGKKRTDETKLLCPNCKADLSRPFKTEYGEFRGWKKGPVVHCKGSHISFNNQRRDVDHHGHQKYYCRKCKGDLGCDLCGQRPVELVCTLCHDWGMNQGEKEHGKMVPRHRLSGAVKQLTEDIAKRKSVEDV